MLVFDFSAILWYNKNLTQIKGYAMQTGVSFRLSEEFVNGYRQKTEPFGFGLLGKVTFYRTYARPKADGTLESWVDVCERVVNWMYDTQKKYCIENNRRWSDEKSITSAEEAFDRMFNFKWSPPGRGLFAAGSPIVVERNTPEALMNCSMVSTEEIYTDGAMPFGWGMEMLMLGVGVGFDTRGAGKVDIVKPISNRMLNSSKYVIHDSREGWAESVEMLIDSYIDNGGKFKTEIMFDYSSIRKAGEPIRGFGGVASGPEILMQTHKDMRRVLDMNSGRPLTSRTIVDLFNMIGRCVVAGNVRRSALIALGDERDNDFANLKNYRLSENEYRMDWAWSSNNSILAKIGMDYDKFIDPMYNNGEPGFVWLENSQNYGRMNGVKDQRDFRAIGTNPCGEQVLESYELCTLTEIYLNRHTDRYDLMRTIKFAYLYAKTVTLENRKIKNKRTREIMMRNRRIGLSLTGIAQFVTKEGIAETISCLDDGYNHVKHYDKRYSDWFGVPESIRVTSVKPSGTVSLLSGSTPGIHFPHSEYYIRRVRLQENSYLVERLRVAGVPIEKDVSSPNTVVAEFPVHSGKGIRRAKDLSIWEQLQLASILQRYWSDNSVSVTISINPAKTTKDELKSAIEMYESQLKSVSFLPELEDGAYEQMVYEEITEKEYNRRVAEIDESKIGNLQDPRSIISTKMEDKYCDGDACEIKF